jgi:UbiD family decarboxylase
MLKQNTAHKATQTIKNTLHTMNTTQKRKSFPITGQIDLKNVAFPELAPLITWPIVVTKGPMKDKQDNFNLGIYHMQVVDKNQDVCGWIILGWILERWDGVMWTGLVWLRIGTGEELLWIWY